MKSKMDAEQLNSYITYRITNILDILKAKGEIYTKDNRFENFNKASDILQQEPEQILIEFMTKHLVWLLDYVKNLMPMSTPTEKEEEEIDEKIGDIINYLLILNAMLHERAKFGKKQQLHSLTKRIIKINEEDAKQEGWA